MATSRSITSVSNTELYDRWAKVYDTDGNILQAIDDHLIPGLLAQAFSLLSSSSSPSSKTSTPQSGITITELGCGTGRNTSKLLIFSLPFLHPLPTNVPPASSTEIGTRFNGRIKDIFALDLSPKMLHLAKSRCEAFINSNWNTLPSLPQTQISPPTNFEFIEFDTLNPSLSTLTMLTGKADLILSTLVLEHLPIAVFFQTAKSFLRKDGGGVLVLTNMHAEMGHRSQAGFLDPETLEKVQGSSFVYEIEEVLAIGMKFGFKVVGEVVEREVREEDVGADDLGRGGGGDGGGEKRRLLGRRGRKWVGCKVWFGCVMRLAG